MLAQAQTQIKGAGESCYHRGKQEPGTKEEPMPVIRVEMWSGRTHAQKRELARAITEAVCAIAETTPEATTVIFYDVERSDWAQAGVLASDEDK
jgi:4-oxalocrotonate tautomerase